jgi:hypothetical protein
MSKYYKVQDEQVEKFEEVTKENDINLKAYNSPLDIFIEEEAPFRLEIELNWTKNVLNDDIKEKVTNQIINTLTENIGMITDNDHISDLTNKAIKDVIPDFYS